MKRCALLAFFCLFGISCFADYECESDPDFSPICYVRQKNYLVYYISTNNQEYSIPADSVWIVNYPEKETVMENIRANQGEFIDISFLPQGYYICYVRQDECVGGDIFYKYEYTVETPIGDVVTPVLSPCKILRNSQLLIDRNGELFTIDGRKFN